MKSRPTDDDALRAQKQKLRQEAYAARNAQPEKTKYSALICDSFRALPAYQSAGTVMLYLSCRSEVRTRRIVEMGLESEKHIVIPYCTRDAAGHNKLGLWRLDSFAELVPGTWKILEPPKERWGEAGKEVSPAEIDLIMVPGVAFDAAGGRLGNGQGYYDRLLAEVRSDCALIGVGFESQIFAAIPMGEYDVFLDGVLTEKRFYRGKGRKPDSPI